MKTLLLLALFPVWSLFGQDSTFPKGKLPQFDLTVRVGIISDKTKKMGDVLVTVSEANGKLVFEGCTDQKGEVYIDSTRIRHGRSYVVRIAADGFYEDRNGAKFTTVGLHYSQNFIIEMALLTGCRLGYFTCYDPQDSTRAADQEWYINHIREMKTAWKNEYDMDVTRLSIGVHYETWDEEERLLQEAKLLLDRLKQELPDIEFDDEIFIEYLQLHEHSGCIRVVRIG